MCSTCGLINKWGQCPGWGGPRPITPQQKLLTATRDAGSKGGSGCDAGKPMGVETQKGDTQPCWGCKRNVLPKEAVFNL